MKNLIKLTTTLMMLLLCIGMVSCSEDKEDDEPKSSSIVGTWQSEEDSDYIIVFKSNGTGYEDWEGERWEFEYTYNAESGRLVMFEEDESYSYKVRISGKTLTLIDEEEDYSETFKKIK